MKRLLLSKTRTIHPSLLLDRGLSAAPSEHHCPRSPAARTALSLALERECWKCWSFRAGYSVPDSLAKLSRTHCAQEACEISWKEIPWFNEALWWSILTLDTVFRFADAVSLGVMCLPSLYCIMQKG